MLSLRNHVNIEADTDVYKPRDVPLDLQVHPGLKNYLHELCFNNLDGFPFIWND